VKWVQLTGEIQWNSIKQHKICCLLSGLTVSVFYSACNLMYKTQ